MFIDLQKVTKDHELWRNWRIENNEIVWHDGSIRIHANQLEQFEYVQTMHRQALYQLRRVESSKLQLNDFDNRILNNILTLIHEIGIAAEKASGSLHTFRSRDCLPECELDGSTENRIKQLEERFFKVSSIS